MKLEHKGISLSVLWEKDECTLAKFDHFRDN